MAAARRFTAEKVVANLREAESPQSHRMTILQLICSALGLPPVVLTRLPWS